MNRTATHAMRLPPASSGAGATPPEWIHLVPAGSFKGRDGRGPWTVTNAAAVIAASELPLAIDEAHATDLGAAAGAAAPARGWIEELEARDDGIWGRVDWTPTGQALLSERAYRGISPTFSHAPNGQVLRLLRAALTNVPNLPQLATLNHDSGQPPGGATLNKEAHHMDLLAELRQLHGLPADADEAAALNACRTAQEAADAHGAALNSIAAAAGVPAGQDATALASAITAARAAAGETGRLAAELVSLQGQVQALNAEKARTRAEAVVDGAIRAGKPIPRTLREHYIARHCVDPAAVETELSGLPALNAGGITPSTDQAAGDAQDPTVIARNARQLQDAERAAGRDISWPEAVARIVAEPRQFSQAASPSGRTA